MGKCEFKFKDSEGNLAKEYYDILKTQGKEAALASYLNYASSIKFSKINVDSTVNDLKAMAASKPKHFKGTTKYIEEVSGDVELDPIIENILDKELKRFIESSKNKNPDLVTSISVEKFKADIANETFVDGLRQSISNELSIKAVAGTLLHRFYEEASKHLNEKWQDPEFIDNMQKAKEDGSIKSYINSEVASYPVAKELFAGVYDKPLEYTVYNPKTKVKETVVITEEHKLKEILNLGEHNLNGTADLLKRFYNKIYDLQIEYNDGKPFTMLPEQKIYHEKSKISGIVDLMLISDSGKVINFDFKTKGEKHIRNIKEHYGKFFEGEYKEIPASEFNKASLQLSIYSLIQEEQYGLTPVENIVLGIPLFTFTNHLTGDVTSKVHLTWASEDAVKPHMTSAENFKEVIEESNAFRDPSRKDMHNDVNNVVNVWSGGIEYSLTNSDSVDSFVNYAKSKIKPLPGNPYCFYKGYKYSGDFSETNIETWLRELYTKVQDTNKNLSSDLITQFRDGTSSNKTLKNQIQLTDFLLSGISKDTHTLVKASSITGMRSLGKDILVAKHKVTGEVSFLSALAVPNLSLASQNVKGAKARTTIFGKYKTDEEILLEGNIPLSKNDTFSFVQTKLAIAAMYYKTNIDNTAKIGDLKIASFAGTGTERISLATFEAVLPKVKLLNKFSKGEIEDFGDISKIIDGFSIKNDEYSPVKKILNLISAGKDPLSLVTNSTSAFNLGAKTKLINSGTLYVDGDLKEHEAVKAALLEYTKAVYYAVSVKLNTKSKKLIVNDPAYRTINGLVYDFLEFKRDLSDSISEQMLSIGRSSASNSGDPLAQKLHNYAVLHHNKVKRAQSKFLAEHNLILKKLIAEKGISYLNFKIGDNHKQLFHNMFIDPEFKDSDINNWMKLKSDDDTSLSTVEKEYIKFFNKSIAAGFNSVNPSASQPNEGTVPIMGISSISDYLHCQSAADFNDVTQRLKRTGGKKQGDPDTLKYDFMFDGERGTESLQGSGHRRHALGINQDGLIEDRTRVKSISMNLATIINMFSLEAQKTVEMTEVLAIQNVVSVFIDQKAQEMGDSRALQGTMKLIDTWARMVVTGTYADDGKVGSALDTIKTIASTSVFFGSVGQAFTEAITNFTQTVALSTSLGIQTLMDNEKAFSVPTLLWAKTQVDKLKPGSLNYEVIDVLGILNPDSDSFKDSVKDITKKGSLLQTKHGYAMAAVFIKDSMGSIALASLKESGVLDAYSLNADKEPEYDEHKDKRFFTKDNPVTEEEKQKKIFYEYYKDQLAKEGGLDENGKIIVPLTVRDKTALSARIIKITGSSSKLESVMFENTAIGRSFLVYKRWFAQKAVNYSTRRHTSETIGKDVWIVDPEVEGGGYYTWQGETVEGILQTVKYICDDLVYQSGILDPRRINKALTPAQKENISKLLADLLIALLMVTIGTKAVEAATSKEYKKTTAYKTLESSMDNAISDLFILSAGQQLFIEGSPFMALSSIVTKASTIASTSKLLLQTNTKAELDANALKMWKITGASKTGRILGDIF